MFRLEHSKLFIGIDDDDGPVPTDDDMLADRFTVTFEISDDHVGCYYDAALVYAHEQALSGAYFKGGTSSCQGEKMVADESCEA